MIDLATSSISFVYNKNNKGPRAVLYATPDKTITHSENVLLTTTCFIQFCNNFNIHLWMLSLGDKLYQMLCLSLEV